MAKKTIYIFDDLVIRAEKQWKTAGLGSDAMNWFRETVQKNYKEGVGGRIFEDGKRLTQTPIPGKMYFFRYDPKHKDTLPYYDTFPFVLPIEVKRDGMLGLNFHYLPLKQRAILLDGLFRTVSDTRYDEKTKMNVSYSMLKSVAKYKWFQPCLKRYLSKHMQTNLVEVHSKEWPMAIFLPVAHWKKESQGTVWRDSIKEI